MILTSYIGSVNLGNVIQTIALQQHVTCTGYVSWDHWHHLKDFRSSALINGYLGSRPPLIGRNCRFVGVYLSSDNYQLNLDWLKRNDGVIGCRDPWTAGLAGGEICGCATLTFPRYDGPRSGELSVDGPNGMTHLTPRSLLWSQQLEMGTKQLETYRRARSVVTSRLHVALPCLAFGTPVKLIRVPGITETKRFTIWDEVGGGYEKWTELDIGLFQQRYVEFLKRAL